MFAIHSEGRCIDLLLDDCNKLKQLLEVSISFQGMLPLKSSFQSVDFSGSCLFSGIMICLNPRSSSLTSVGINETVIFSLIRDKSSTTETAGHL